MPRDIDESDLAANLARDRVAHFAGTTQALIDTMTRSATDAALEHAALILVRHVDLNMVSPGRMLGAQLDLFEETPEIRSHFVKQHGLLAIVEALQTRSSVDLITSLVRLVNVVRASFAPLLVAEVMQLVDADAEVAEKVCVRSSRRRMQPALMPCVQLLGGCPKILQLVQSDFSNDTRLEAAIFVGSLARISDTTVRR
jgi:hypothetical protein